jgi:Zn-dependent protease
VGLVTIHKLIAAAAAVFLVLAFRQFLKAGHAATALEISLAVISAVLFVALIATGALLTREDLQLPRIVLKIHQVAPLLALVSSAATFFLMIQGRS